jgi:hypothetical protein
MAINGYMSGDRMEGERPISWRRIGAAAVMALLTIAALEPARAQQPPPQLTIQLFPYLWLPTINTTVKYPVLGGGTATTTVSTGAGDYIPKLNFGAMLAGEVDYDRFSLLTDILYLNLSSSNGHIRSFDLGLTSIPVDRTLSTSTSVRLGSAIWTLAGGYRVADDTWGSVDAIAGFRLLNVSDITDFSLSIAVTRPDGSVALGRTGSLSVSRDIWNGIGGLRGRINIADGDWFGGGRFFIPFYFDIGAGGSNLTWQVFSGIGYQTKWVGVSIAYRYLSFNQGSSAVVQKLSLRGPTIAANFKF